MDAHYFKELYNGNDMFSPMFLVYDYKSNKTISSSNVIFIELEKYLYKIIKDSDRYTRASTAIDRDISKIVLETMSMRWRDL